MTKYTKYLEALGFYSVMLMAVVGIITTANWAFSNTEYISNYASCILDQYCEIPSGYSKEIEYWESIEFEEKYKTLGYFKDDYYYVRFYDKDKCLGLYEIKGISMFPYTKYNSKAIIDLCFNPEDLEVNDVIFFLKQSNLKKIYHRIIEIDLEKDYILTKGDNNWKPDAPIRINQVYGRMVGHFPVYSYQDVEADMNGEN